MILDQLVNDESKAYDYLQDMRIPPSSILIIEVWVDGEGEYYVKASFNDQEVALGNCDEGNDCKLKSLVNWLDDNTNHSNDDVKDKC